MRPRSRHLPVLLALCVALAACRSSEAPLPVHVPDRDLEIAELEPPTVERALWPSLASDRTGAVALTWTVERGDGHELHWALLSAGRWSPVEVAARGDSWFVNWADFPQAALAPVPTVTWLDRLGSGTFDYGVRIARRNIGAWSAPAWLHDDQSASEHGFVSLASLGAGRVHAVWLDGRHQHAAEGGAGAMSLYSRTIEADGTLGTEVFLDDRVCDCCQTDSALLDDGRVLVAWRDRGEDEVRDISYAYGRPDDHGSWTEARSVRDDGWLVPSCPVNGPAVATDGKRAAIAWFTLGREARERVFVALVPAGGDEIERVVRIDGGRPLGRVDACYLPDGQLLVTWLEKTSGGAAWRARLVDDFGGLGATTTLAHVSGERRDGFLRLAPTPEGALATFVDGDSGQLRLLALRQTDG